MPHKKVVFYLSDEIFAIRAPILVTIDAQSSAILKIELASDRSAKTWETHFQDLGAHRFHSLGMASDRGVGLQAGYQAAGQDGFWVCDQFHAFQDLFNRCHQLERKAYAALGKEIKAAETFANAKSEANRHKRLEHYEPTRQACAHAIERYDQLDLLLGMLRETLHLCSDLGRLHTVEGVRADLTLLLSLMEEMEDEKLPKLLKPIRSHMDDILVPFRRVEQTPRLVRAQGHAQGAHRRHRAIVVAQSDGNAFVCLEIEDADAHGAKRESAQARLAEEPEQGVGHTSFRLADKGR